LILLKPHMHSDNTNPKENKTHNVPLVFVLFQLSSLRAFNHSRTQPPNYIFFIDWRVS
jgi:hypothetical protein